jgi:hypothetical protein
MSLAEQGIRKGETIFRLNPEGIGPPRWRTKDVGDFAFVHRNLLESKGYDKFPNKAWNELVTLEESFVAKGYPSSNAVKIELFSPPPKASGFSVPVPNFKVPSSLFGSKTTDSFSPSMGQSYESAWKSQSRGYSSAWKSHSRGYSLAGYSPSKYGSSSRRVSNGGSKSPSARPSASKDIGHSPRDSPVSSISPSVSPRYSPKSLYSYVSLGGSSVYTSVSKSKSSSKSLGSRYSYTSSPPEEPPPGWGFTPDIPNFAWEGGGKGVKGGYRKKRIRRGKAGEEDYFNIGALALGGRQKKTKRKTIKGILGFERLFR